MLYMILITVYMQCSLLISVHLSSCVDKQMLIQLLPGHLLRKMSNSKDTVFLLSVKYIHNLQNVRKKKAEYVLV